MYDDQKEIEVVGNRPSTVTVLTLLLLAAFVFSYLWAYALWGALASAGVVSGWGPEDDPRPRLMTVVFVGLLTVFTLSGGLFRVLSARQLRQLDSIGEEGG